MKILVAIPLTLTLSRGEREPPLDTFLKFKCRVTEVRHRFAEFFKCGTKTRRDYARTLGVFPPLPRGEGRGEGKVHEKEPPAAVCPISSKACL
jgi:hypothetical protein